MTQIQKIWPYLWGQGFFETENGLNSDLKAEIWLKSEFESVSIPVFNYNLFAKNMRLKNPCINQISENLRDKYLAIYGF